MCLSARVPLYRARPGPTLMPHPEEWNGGRPCYVCLSVCLSAFTVPTLAAFGCRPGGEAEGGAPSGGLCWTSRMEGPGLPSLLRLWDSLGLQDQLVWMLGRPDGLKFEDPVSAAPSGAEHVLSTLQKLRVLAVLLVLARWLRWHSPCSS